MIKLLIVDDSALMRRHISSVFEEDGGFIIRVARDGKEAVRENLSFEPDVITLDVNMPEMDGLTALSLIMVQRAVPVIMVSSLTEKGALATFEALNLGAVDYVAKPGGTISLSIEEIKRDLLSKVRAAARSRPRSRTMVRSAVMQIKEEREMASQIRASRTSNHAPVDGMVLIGVSTGGPRTLEEILPQLPSEFPLPVLIAQHMPSAFTKSFAERLDAITPMKVVEVASPMELQKGVIYVAKGVQIWQLLNVPVGYPSFLGQKAMNFFGILQWKYWVAVQWNIACHQS